MQPPPPPPPAPRLAECPGPGDAGLAFPAPDRRADPAKLKVATFNAEWLFDGVGDNSRSPWRDDPAGAAGHLARVADVLAGLDADLVNLAEVEDCAVLKALAENLNARPGNAGREYAPYLVKGKDTYTGQNVALLARVDPVGPLDRTEARAAYPVAGSACGYGGEAHDYGVSKHYRALFHIGGRKVAVLGCHFLAFPTDKTRCAKREAQATVVRDLAEAARGKGYDDVVILGDFNDYSDAVPDVQGSRPTSRVLRLLRDLDADGRDDLAEAAALLPQAQRWTSWWDHLPKDGKDGGTAEHTSIDHLLLSNSLMAYAASAEVPHGMDPTAVSDHWPLAVTLDFGAPPHPSPPPPPPVFPPPPPPCDCCPQPPPGLPEPARERAAAAAAASAQCPAEEAGPLPQALGISDQAFLVGAGGLAVGLAVGGLAGWLWGRRRAGGRRGSVSYMELQGASRRASGTLDPAGLGVDARSRQASLVRGGGRPGPPPF